MNFIAADVSSVFEIPCGSIIGTLDVSGKIYYYVFLEVDQKNSSWLNCIAIYSQFTRFRWTIAY